MARSKCDWCKKSSNNLNEHIDSLRNINYICEDCMKKIKEHKCRKCEALTDSMFEIQGLCMNCYQAELYKINKRKEAVRLGVDSEIAQCLTSDLEFTDADYEHWVTMGKTYSIDDAKNSVELRRMWILIKLNSTGLYDQDIILKNFKDIEILLDRNLSKLVNKKCKIIIGNSAETRAMIRQSDVLDMENAVVIAMS